MVDEDGQPQPGDETLSQSMAQAEVRAYSRSDARVADWSAVGCGVLVVALVVFLAVWGWVAFG